jgi:hypothetical protein
MTNILTMLSVSHVVQGIIVGGVLAFITANIIINAVVKAMTTTVNGWSTCAGYLRDPCAPLRRSLDSPLRAEG